MPKMPAARKGESDWDTEKKSHNQGDKRKCDHGRAPSSPEVSSAMTSDDPPSRKRADLPDRTRGRSRSINSDIKKSPIGIAVKGNHNGSGGELRVIFWL